MSISDVNQMFLGFNWYSPSWDLFIFLFWAVASVMYAFAAGRGRVISLLMSLYIAKLLVLQAPWLPNAINGQLPGSLLSLQQLISFLIIFIVLFMLLSRYAFRTSADGRHFGSIIFSVIFSFLQVGLLINTILSYLAVSGKTFSPLVNLIFVSDLASFVWIILPLLFLIFLGRAVSEHHAN
jgi:hypothetical protein